MTEQLLYFYDESKKIKCEHDFGKDFREMGIVTLKVDGDAFIQNLVCKKCGIKVDRIFNNKQSEFWVILNK